MVQEYKNILNENIVQRILTIIFLLPILLYFIHIGGFLIKSLMIVLSIFLSNEWYVITQKNKNLLPHITFIVLVAFIVATSFFLDFTFSILSAILISFFYIFEIKVKKCILGKNDKWLFYGFMYISIPLLIFIQIINLYEGKKILFCFLLIVFSTDIFSYISGNIIKGPKIFPILSPTKTYSGTVLGVLFGSIIGVLFSLKWLNFIELPYVIIFCMIISLSAILGDLLISKIKRFFKVKDSGNLLPGHGGFLDRYDSIALSLVILFFLVNFF